MRPRVQIHPPQRRFCRIRFPATYVEACTCVCTVCSIPFPCADRAVARDFCSIRFLEVRVSCCSWDTAEIRRQALVQKKEVIGQEDDDRINAKWGSSCRVRSNATGLNMAGIESIRRKNIHAGRRLSLMSPRKKRRGTLCRANQTAQIGDQFFVPDDFETWITSL